MKILKFLPLLFLCQNTFGFDFVMNCKKDSSYSDYIYLIKVTDYESTYSGHLKFIIDSCEIKNNKVIFKNLEANNLYRAMSFLKIQKAITINGVDDNYLNFISLGKNIECNSTINQLTYSSEFVNIDNLLFLEYNNYYKKSSTKQVYENLHAKIKRGEKIEEQKVIAQLMKANSDDSLNYLKILKKTNSEVLSTFLIYNMNFNIKSIEGLNSLVNLKGNLFKAKFKNPYVNSFLLYYNQQKSTYNYSEFRNDLYNSFKTEINIDTISKKYILFDLWASWCVSCRLEIKNKILPNINNKNI